MLQNKYVLHCNVESVGPKTRSLENQNLKSKAIEKWPVS